MQFWSEAFIDIWRNNFIGFAILFILLGYCVYIAYRCYLLFKEAGKKEFLKLNWNFADPRIDLLLFILPAFLHFIGICLSNASHYERYFFILMPQIFLILFRMVYLFNKRTLVASAALFFLIGFVINLKAPAERLHPDEKKGNLIFQIRDILNPNSFLHSTYKWDIYPIEYRFNHNTCVTEECVNLKRQGAAFFDSQFVTELVPEPKLFRILPQKDVDKTTVSINSSQDLLEIFEKRIRIYGSFYKTFFQKTKSVGKVINRFSYEENLEDWTVEYVSNSNSSIKLKIIFSPFINWGNSTAEHLIANQKSFSVLIRDVELFYKERSVNLSSLALVLWKKKAIHLLPIDYEFSPGEIPLELNLIDSKTFKIGVLNGHKEKM